MITALVVLGLAMQPRSFGESAVWRPPADFRAKVLAACEKAGRDFGSCFAGQMKVAGASAGALAFTHLLDNNGYMTAFRPLGNVGAAAVNYPFRANENDGLYLVNGEPAAIDIDALQKLPTDQMKADATYAAMVEQHPKAVLWPGNRSSTSALLALPLPNGSQQWLVGYRVQDGCHACAVLGQAFFRFSFDAKGKFMGAAFSGFTPQKPAAGSDSSLWMLATKVNSTFIVALPANPSTGYSWSIRPTTGPAEIRSVNHALRTPAKSPPGTPGEEYWTLRSGHAGEHTLHFIYARPWEKNSEPAEKLDLLVRVE